MTTDLTKTDKSTLTPTEERLLFVCSNPENLGASVTEKCKLAETSRDSYYRIMKNKRFIDALEKTAIDLIREHSSEIIQSALKTAVNGGSRGHADRRMLLEMLNLYSSKSTIALYATANIEDMADEDRLKRLLKLQEKLSQPDTIEAPPGYIRK